MRNPFKLLLKSGLTMSPELERDLASGVEMVAPFSGHDFSPSYARIYRDQPAVRSVIDFIAKNLAQVRAKVYDHDEDGYPVPLPKHPAQVVLDHPSPGVARSEFARQIFTDHLIYDTAAVLKVQVR